MFTNHFSQPRTFLLCNSEWKRQSIIFYLCVISSWLPSHCIPDTGHSFYSSKPTWVPLFRPFAFAAAGLTIPLSAQCRFRGLLWHPNFQPLSFTLANFVFFLTLFLTLLYSFNCGQWPSLQGECFKTPLYFVNASIVAPISLNFTICLFAWLPALLIPLGIPRKRSVSNK